MGCKTLSYSLQQKVKTVSIICLMFQAVLWAHAIWVSKILCARRMDFKCQKLKCISEYKTKTSICSFSEMDIRKILGRNGSWSIVREKDVHISYRMCWPRSEFNYIQYATHGIIVDEKELSDSVHSPLYSWNISISGCY